MASGLVACWRATDPLSLRRGSSDAAHRSDGYDCSDDVCSGAPWGQTCASCTACAACVKIRDPGDEAGRIGSTGRHLMTIFLIFLAIGGGLLLACVLFVCHYRRCGAIAEDKAEKNVAPFCCWEGSDNYEKLTGWCGACWGG